MRIIRAAEEFAAFSCFFNNNVSSVFWAFESTQTVTPSVSTATLSPTVEPIQPTATPVPPSPTPIQSGPVIVLGDVNGDGKTDILDFNIWRDEFLGNSQTKSADFNKDGKIDLIDFSIWRNAIRP